jgi:hypothetical protein
MEYLADGKPIAEDGKPIARRVLHRLKIAL